MHLLLDTHLLLWAASEPERLSSEAEALITSPDHQLWFSAASIWEVSIKTGLGRTDFQVSPQLLRRGLVENDYHELAINAQHAASVTHLPNIHKDPFDRMLLAQAEYEGFLLLTVDEMVLRYSGPIRDVR